MVSQSPNSLARLRRCKIVATVGPSSSSPSGLALLARTGVDVFRINFSHGSREDHKKVIAAIRQMEPMIGRSVAVLADLQGPKIRVGTLQDGSFEFVWGEEIDLVCTAEQTEGEKFVPIPHPEIFEVSEPGDKLLFDDGRLGVELVSVSADRAVAKVTMPGTLTNKKGVNVPDKRLKISAVTDKDKLDMQTAIEAGVDFVALSFVQHPDDIKEARELAGPEARILSKIEKPSALEYLEEIIAASDAVMVARGDLGVEMPAEQVPVHQRRIVRTARQYGKPVVIATQMLESMINSPVPTRAETSDVATAVYQGADAVMLSAESAVGRHPQTVVAIMDRIIRAIEQAEDYHISLEQYTADPDNTTQDAICHAAADAAETLKCKAILAFTSTGSTVKRLSRARPLIPIVMLTEYVTTARRGALYWGVIPLVQSDIGSYEDMVKTGKQVASDLGADPDDRIVITAGYPFGRPGKTNLLQVTRVDPED
ncbi:MAG: pyruvate kinase [Ponticaulis sp.]|nr:pyruvate kinase [Ponticaulis sp.]